MGFVVQLPMAPAFLWPEPGSDYQNNTRKSSAIILLTEIWRSPRFRHIFKVLVLCLYAGSMC